MSESNSAGNMFILRSDSDFTEGKGERGSWGEEWEKWDQTQKCHQLEMTKEQREKDRKDEKRRVICQLMGIIRKQRGKRKVNLINHLK